MLWKSSETIDEFICNILFLPFLIPDIHSVKPTTVKPCGAKTHFLWFASKLLAGRNFVSANDQPSGQTGHSGRIRPQPASPRRVIHLGAIRQRWPCGDSHQPGSWHHHRSVAFHNPLNTCSWIQWKLDITHWALDHIKMRSDTIILH